MRYALENANAEWAGFFETDEPDNIKVSLWKLKSITKVWLHLTLRLLFTVFFQQICIDDYVFSVHGKTKISCSMVLIGPAAEALGGHKLNMNDKKKYYKEHS